MYTVRSLTTHYANWISYGELFQFLMNKTERTFSKCSYVDNAYKFKRLKIS